MKFTRYHGKMEEIKCMNAWPFRDSIFELQGFQIFIFNPPLYGGRGEAALVYLQLREDRGEINLLLNPQ